METVLIRDQQDTELCGQVLGARLRLHGMWLHRAPSSYVQAKLLSVLLHPYQALQERSWFLHFTDEDTETQSCLKSYSYWVVKPGFQTQVSLIP